MKHLLAGAAGFAAAFAFACIDFDLSQQKYCESLTCQRRAQVCADGPQITRTVPDRGANGVALTSSVTVTYSQTVGCTDAGIRLVQYTGPEPPVAGMASCTGNTVTFTPSAALLNGRVYKVYVDDCQVWNDAGVGGLDASWTFTTAP
ncbi:MAG TPA: Ig-like domain-containing protein [Myxococcales bacterium]|nr:Ig-like domain-containing protein [Myxococcales bacterium]